MKTEDKNFLIEKLLKIDEKYFLEVNYGKNLTKGYVFLIDKIYFTIEATFKADYDGFGSVYEFYLTIKDFNSIEVNSKIFIGDNYCDGDLQLLNSKLFEIARKFGNSTDEIIILDFVLKYL